MREKSSFYISILLLLMIFIPTISLADDDNETWYIEGGNSVIMEQYTATWCDVCAKIDPWISDFVDDRGSRIIRIALHDPVNDPLGDSITTERLSNYDGGQELAPSFWFDSGNEVKGLVAANDLDRALLNSEGIRGSDTMISISVSEEQTTNSLKLVIIFEPNIDVNNSQASIFLLADKTIDSTLATNGITLHEDVTRGYINIDFNDDQSSDSPISQPNFNSGFSNISMVKNSTEYTVSLNYLLDDENIEDISVVAAHEYVIDGERSTLGAVSISLGQSNNNDELSIFVPLILIILISTTILFKDRSH